MLSQVPTRHSNKAFITASGQCASIQSQPIIPPHLEYRLFRFGQGFANDIINWQVPTASRGVNGGWHGRTVDLCVIVGAVVRSVSARTPTTGSRCRRLRSRNHCHSQYCLASDPRGTCGNTLPHGNNAAPTNIVQCSL